MGSIALSLAKTLSPEHTVPVDFEVLFVAHYPAVFRLAYRLAGTREAAEDLAQEAFLRLHRTPGIWKDQVHDRSNPVENRRVAAWLYRVATNLSYNYVRAQGRQKRREDASIGVISEVDPADLAERTETRLAVRQALATLPERQVQLLLLRHAGLSYKELAEALDVAPGSVGTLLARAETAFEKVYRRTDPGCEHDDSVSGGDEGA